MQLIVYLNISFGFLRPSSISYSCLDADACAGSRARMSNLNMYRLRALGVLDGELFPADGAGVLLGDLQLFFHHFSSIATFARVVTDYGAPHSTCSFIYKVLGSVEASRALDGAHN